MSKVSKAFAEVWPVVRFILTHKATYRFLVVILGALGVANADHLGDTLEAIATALFGPLG